MTIAATNSTPEHWSEQLFSSFPLPMWIYEVGTLRLLDVNHAAVRGYGYSRSEFMTMTIMDFRPANDVEKLKAHLGRPSGESKEPRIWRHRRKDGELIDVEIISQSVNYQGRPARAVVAHNISDRIRVEKALRQSNAVLESTHDGVVVTDLSPKIVAVNQAYCEITGYSEEEVLGQNPNLVQSGRHNKDFYKEMWKIVRETGRWVGEIWNRRKSGELYPQILTIRAVYDDKNRICNYVGVFTDISQIEQSKARLERLSHFDHLTDLPNRLLASSRLSHAVDRSRESHQRVAVLYLDVDRFKTVNDSLGPDSGDELLRAISVRLRQCIRKEDTLARMGGDEFMVILEHIEGPRDAAVLAKSLIDAMKQPFSLRSGHSIYSSISIGISLFPDDGGDASEMMQHADLAMSMAKQQGRSTFCFHVDSMSIALHERLSLETRLAQGLAAKEFVLHYQPLVEGKDGEVIGHEALVRWHPKGQASVPPGKFIPVAEDTGLILELGHWVLRTSCQQARQWIDQGSPPRVMAVNISARQFQSSGFVATVQNALQESGLPAGLLELELTESMFMEHVEASISTMHALKALGVRLAMDDFGTGYSSLSYLKRFPIDKLKIDRSFVQGIVSDASDQEIVSTIIAMANGLKLEVLAEGVETLEQKDMLIRLGCRRFQGFLFGRPVPAELYNEKGPQFVGEYSSILQSLSSDCSVSDAQQSFGPHSAD